MIGRVFFITLLLVAWMRPSAHSFEASLEVDRIEFVGVSIFQQSDIEATLELSVGDKLERAKVVRTEENLQELYRIHGYEEVRIRTELLRKRNDKNLTENILRFTVIEGKPTRVAAIKLIPENIRDDSFNHYWQKIEKILVARLGISVNDIFDQERASAGKRALQDVLASEEFIGAKADDVRIIASGPPSITPKGPVARWVELEFHVDLGDRVSFGFRGNAVFTPSKLSSLVEEQRIVGFGKDYIGAIRSRIEEEYHSVGYAKVEVTPYTFERPSGQERHITFVINEGPRVTIHSIEFDGNNVFNNSKLIEQFYQYASRLVQRKYYVEKEVEKALALVVEWMKSQGYLAAKLVAVSRSFISHDKSVHLIAYIYEGDQTLVQSAHFSGVTLFSESKILEMLNIQVGQPLNLFAFSEGLEAFKSAYRSRGYLGMKIQNEITENVVRYSQENRLADIALDISEGPQYRVSRIETEGLSFTKENIVRRELDFHAGDILEESKITASEANLRKLGIFSVVSIHAIDDPQREGYKIVRLSLQEGTPGIVTGGIGFRNDLGLRTFGQVAYANLWHENHTLSFNANVNRRFINFNFIEYQFQLGYVWPWFFLHKMSFRPTLTFNKIQYLHFSTLTSSFAATLERELLREPHLTGFFSYSLERTKTFNAQFEVDNQTQTIGSVIPSIQLDMRDNPLAPTSGLFTSASFEVASPVLLSQTALGYTRFQLRSDYLIPLSKEASWFLSFRTGFERSIERPITDSPFDSSGAIPTYKQFAIGGVGSLRGFGEQELNFQQKLIRGTLSYVNYRTQIDLPFSGPMRFGPFLDAANLLVDRFSFGILRYGAGMGFHYQTPIGPVNFDWGFKINPQSGEDHYRFYFSIGIV